MQANAVNCSMPGRCESRGSVRIRSGWWQLVLVLFALYVLPVQAQYRASLQGTVADSHGRHDSGSAAVSY